MENNSTLIVLAAAVAAYFVFKQVRAAIAGGRIAKLVASGSPLVLVDVRSPAEHADRRIAGSVNVPLDRLQADIARAAPDKAAPLAVYCQSGSRSSAAAGILKRLGYAEVVNLGGIGSWKGEFASGPLKKRRA